MASQKKKEKTYRGGLLGGATAGPLSRRLLGLLGLLLGLLLLPLAVILEQGQVEDVLLRLPCVVSKQDYCYQRIFDQVGKCHVARAG